MEENKKFLSSLNFWKGVSLFLLIICVVLAVMIYQDKNEQNVSIPQASVDKAMKFINGYLLGGETSASLVKVYEEATPYYKIDISINGTTFPSFISLDGKYIFPNEPYEISDLFNSEINDTDGNFKEIVNAEVCSENDKPIIYFFGLSTCPHCSWEEPIIKEVVDKFGDKISYHENIDSSNDKEVFQKFSTGSYPLLVLGCKYYRLGSGENEGADKEKATLTKLICNLTQNQPEEICK